MRFDWSVSPSSTEVKVNRILDADAVQLRSGSSPFLVVDSEVWRLWESEIVRAIRPEPAEVFTVDAREDLKTVRTVESLCAAMFESGTHRDGSLVAVGGGLTCDVAAFAASIWLRGIELVLVPTTLLAMVDACLGGKTGVNLAGAKNQIGSFYPAGLVVVATDFLRTLPRAEVLQGMAEALKTSVLADRDIAELLGSDVGKDRLPELVRRCLAAKGAIVARDLRDLGGRRLLNLGHTLGHALESSSGFEYSHGQAVGLGMLGAAAMAARRGGRPALAGELRGILESIGLPVRLEGKVDPAAVTSFLDHDKKTGGDGRTWVLPYDWEDCRLENLSPREEAALLEVALGELR
ncbi:iron-containing alcohol dehydrogenase [Candidatus Fermentibacteria bacterium]|nr:iron-containing alcohol dehydrogenase [Candidatus Fermentibacteria bacterium]